MTNNKSFILRAAILALLPLICSVIYLLSTGKWFGDVSIAASEWNDELFYFKQVESVVKYGIPQGYFGFNESHAISLSFAAWSPVLVLPWLIWGKLFGWTMVSPFVCNLVFYAVTIFIFSLLVKPDWKQTAVFAILFIINPLNVRYIFSSMPEVLVWGNVLVFYGLALSWLREKKNWKLYVLFGLGILMTLMRPYLVLLLLLPMFFNVLSAHKGLKWAAVGIDAGILVITLGAYFCINHFLAAEYFTPLYKTEWIKVFFSQGIGAGFKNLVSTTHITLADLKGRIIEAFTGNRADGAFFALFIIVGVIFLIKVIRDINRYVAYKRPNDKNRMIIEIHFLLTVIVMFFAIVIMYKLTEGSKHLLTFVIVGTHLIAATTGIKKGESEESELKRKTSGYLLPAILGGFLIFLIVTKWNDAYNYLVPYGSETLSARLEYWTGTFEKSMELDEDDTPNYDNTVLWVFSDNQSADADSSIQSAEYPASGDYSEATDMYPNNTDWQMLYALPAGFGISCCYQDYVISNFDSLEAEYITVVSGGEVDVACSSSGRWTLMGSDGMMSFWKRN